MKPIDFYFSIGSTYTWLTVMRLPDYARKTGGNHRSRNISPSPTATANNINGKPQATPCMCGSVLRKPKVAPDAASMALFGPGVQVAGGRHDSGEGEQRVKRHGRDALGSASLTIPG